MSAKNYENWLTANAVTAITKRVTNFWATVYIRKRNTDEC